ncbi:hypothetical protein LCGC14_3081980, partial [marine sediment metagenome]
RYTARVIRGVKIGPSPPWMAQRLQTLGIALINNVVDISNYVLMECGQPLHTFDCAKLHGAEIIVRRPTSGETIEAIDHKTYELSANMCMICDSRDPVAVGGVMGGAQTEISEATTDILIEAAEFERMLSVVRARTPGVPASGKARWTTARYEARLDGHRLVAGRAELQVVYAAELELNNDISRKMKRRAAYRRTRRGRKIRYRPARWLNRASMRKSGHLAPSIRSKLESHLREKRFVESILPVGRWVVETANFDIHRITNPKVTGRGYQEGPQKGYRKVKAYVLHRDGYKCQHKEKGCDHSAVLCVHHTTQRNDGGSDSPDNLITLCRTCHDALHDGKWRLSKRKPSKT